MDFKKVLIYDRIKEDLRIFCANKTVDDVYNEEFLTIVDAVKADVEKQIKELGNNGVAILNLVIPKPDIPKDIAQNYKQVKVQWTEQLVAKQQKISEINNQIVKEKENNLADIAKYAKDKEAEGNRELYSPEYVKLKIAQSLSNNTKFFFSGQDSILGSLLTKILAAQ